MIHGQYILVGFNHLPKCRFSVFSVWPSCWKIQITINNYQFRTINGHKWKYIPSWEQIIFNSTVVFTCKNAIHSGIISQVCTNICLHSASGKNIFMLFEDIFGWYILSKSYGTGSNKSSKQCSFLARLEMHVSELRTAEIGVSNYMYP